MTDMTKPHNLYFHIPFCASKCNYCAFYSHACAVPDWDGWCDGILAEIEWAHDRLGTVDVPTIFFGGGTPSLMPTDIFKNIMQRVAGVFNVQQNCEISLESNPGTLDKKKLTEFQAIGINRLSVGVQSFNDDILKFMGRRHSAADAVQLLNAARNTGLRTSADFIYGLGDQSVDDVQKLCGQINNMGLSHCSMYELSIEPGTPFSKMNLTMPDNDTMADMYNMIGTTLMLPRYEVSNYATPGDVCRHNQNIWDGDPYIGFGRAACGRPFIDGIWYEQEGANKKFTPLNTPTRALEKIMTGLRTIRGVNLTPDTAALIDYKFVETHPELIVITPANRLVTTPNGMLTLNDLLVHLIK